MPQFLPPTLRYLEDVPHEIGPLVLSFSAESDPQPCLPVVSCHAHNPFSSKEEVDLTKGKPFSWAGPQSPNLTRQESISTAKKDNPQEGARCKFSQATFKEEHIEIT